MISWNEGSNAKYPIVLLLLDGWGVPPSSASEFNVIDEARTPIFDKLTISYPATVLQTHGMKVGTPSNQVPNPETNYFALGTGRAEDNNLIKIHRSIENGSFFDNKILSQAMDRVVANNSKLHLLGLTSEASVHSSFEHLRSLVLLAKKKNISPVYLHLILDGTEERGDKGIEYIKRVQKMLSEYGVGKIATISGRFYAMDRDNHWERTSKVYQAMTKGEGKKTASPLSALKENYNKHIFDKEVFPIVITDEENVPISLVGNGDSIILSNTKPERFTQLAKAFTVPGLNKTPLKRSYLNIHFSSFVGCGNNIPGEIAFPSKIPKNTLGEILDKNNFKQLRLSSSEKFGLTTYYFNGKKEGMNSNAKEEIYSMDNGILTHKLSERIVEDLRKEEHDIIICSLSNLDRIAKSTPHNETIKMIENVDSSLEAIYKEVINRNGVLLITSAIGKMENIYQHQTETFMPQYSSNGVPLILVGREWEGKKIKKEKEVGGNLNVIKPTYSLVDIAPTILKNLNIAIPEEMEGEDII